MSETKPEPRKDPVITVAGVTFSADQVKSAVVTIAGRDIHIGEREQSKDKAGFRS